LRIYKTNRLILRELDESYSFNVLNFYIRNRSFLKKWEAKKPIDFYSIKYQSELLRKERQLSNDGRLLRLWLFHKNDHNFSNIIGCILFSTIIRGNFQSCILGYKMDKEELNKGYITEALKKGIEVIFKEYKLNRIEAPIMPKNKASIRVVQKLGFNNEGISRKYIKVNDKWEDHIRWVLINDEEQ